MCNATGWEAQNKFTQHVGRHMEEIALLTLPLEENSEDESDAQKSDARHSVKSSFDGSITSADDGLGVGSRKDISDLLRQSPDPNHSATKGPFYPCPICNRYCRRKNDLAKHMERHSKPYGCTFDGCRKAFGSKNDWKRHERTQHEQQECWRCHLCFAVFYIDRSHYVMHMISAHSVEHPEDIANRVRIARNHQGRFWCGFCKEIIVHTKTDQEALDLRFDHIASHFQKENRNSGQWEEVATGKTKQELKKMRAQDKESSLTTEFHEHF
jgi:hypothetical protein